MSKQAFIDLVTADQPEAPPYFIYDAVLNSKERPTLDETLERQLKPLTLAQLLELQANGSQVLDTRDADEFAASHLVGSINIGLAGQYATWAGTVLNHRDPIVIIASPGRENESAVRLGRIGFDNVAGYLQDGLSSVSSRPELIGSVERLSAAFLAQLLSSAHPPLPVDVRTPSERRQRLIPGSMGIPLNHLVENLNTLPDSRPLVVYCAGGYRSSIAASLLKRNGFTGVAELAGGIAAWESADWRSVRSGRNFAVSVLLLRGSGLVPVMMLSSFHGFLRSSICRSPCLLITS